MKSLIKVAAISALIAAPIVSFAQSNQPVTRAQVRAELVQLERAGYNPAEIDDATYPAQIQAAEAKVAADRSGQLASNTAGSGVENSGVGAEATGTSARGARIATRGSTRGQSCVGPVSSCNIYFGN